jgi:hypothetical protein
MSALKKMMAGTVLNCSFYSDRLLNRNGWGSLTL